MATLFDKCARCRLGSHKWCAGWVSAQMAGVDKPCECPCVDAARLRKVSR